MITLRVIFATKLVDFGYEVLEDGVPIGRLRHDGSLRRWGIIHYITEYTTENGKWIPTIRECYGTEGFTSIVAAMEEFYKFSL